VLCVAVISSSGGGVATTMGHTYLGALLQSLDAQLQNVGHDHRKNPPAAPVIVDDDDDDDDTTRRRGDGGGGGTAGSAACLMHALLVSLDSGKGMDGANETTDRATVGSSYRKQQLQERDERQ
jgi:hypothetical protein